jgi:hypothetical protein
MRVAIPPLPHVFMVWRLIKHRIRLNIVIVNHRDSFTLRRFGSPVSWCLVVFIHIKSRDSSVGIATRLQAGRSGFYGSISGGAGNLSLRHRVQNGSGVRPASYPMGTRSFLPGVKLPGR